MLLPRIRAVLDDEKEAAAAAVEDTLPLLPLCWLFDAAPPSAAAVAVSLLLIDLEGLMMMMV